MTVWSWVYPKEGYRCLKNTMSLCRRSWCGRGSLWEVLDVESMKRRVLGLDKIIEPAYHVGYPLNLSFLQKTKLCGTNIPVSSVAANISLAKLPCPATG